MIAISLQSGSSGNCIYVETAGVRILIDAGITGVQAQERLAAHGRNIRDVHAVLITHDHGDHVQHAGVYQRKFGIPVYISPATLAAAASRRNLGKLTDVRHFRSDDKIHINDAVVHAVSTPHDGVDGSIFVIEAAGKRLGVMTDLGHVFKGLRDTVASLDAVFLESNYDPAMLAAGPYPAYLKQRIKGPKGHISNIEAAELLRHAIEAKRLQWACLAHLSAENNHPDLALKTHREIFGGELTLHVADRYQASEIFTVA